MVGTHNYERVVDEEEGLELREPSRKFEVKVLDVKNNGTTKSVYVSDGGNVRELMVAIEAAFEGAPASRQRLICSGRPLKPEDSLASHKLAAEGETRIVHLMVRPVDATPHATPAEPTANPLVGDVMDEESRVHVLTLRTPRRAESLVRAGARVRLLSSLLALFCALNALTYMLDATSSRPIDDDDPTAGDQPRDFVDLGLNIAGLWVGGAGLRASRYLDLVSADRYDRSLRVFAVAYLSYQAYYQIVVPSDRGDDDDGAINYNATSTNDDGISRDDQILSGFLSLLLWSAIWLFCVNNSARLRAMLRDDDGVTIEEPPLAHNVVPLD